MPLSKASQIRGQKKRQRGWKLYSWHAPETECIGKGKARAPYEFGVMVSLNTNKRCKAASSFSMSRRYLETLWWPHSEAHLRY